jgi:thiamine biosynthesis protein ThiS
MRVTVNGQQQDVQQGTTAADLINSYNFEPRHVAVEINRDLVPRARLGETVLREDDRIEIVTLVGGG